MLQPLLRLMLLEKNNTNSEKIGPILAIDYGTKCCGLAISDNDCTVALPYKAIFVRDAEKAGMSVGQVIADECNKRGVVKIILGLPLKDDLSESTMTGRVREFRADLERHTGTPIEFSDEYLTSHMANDLLKDKKDKTKQDRDILSAQILLTNYLEK